MSNNLPIYDGTKPTAESAKVKGKKAHSTWMITVNTNKSYVDANDPAFAEAKKNLAAAVTEALDGDGLWRFVRFKAGNKDDVEEVHMTGALERGERANKLHIHVLLHIAHRANIHFEAEKFGEFVSAKLGFKCYTNFKLHNYRLATLEDYIKKGLAGSRMLVPFMEGLTGGGQPQAPPTPSVEVQPIAGQGLSPWLKEASGKGSDGVAFILRVIQRAMRRKDMAAKFNGSYDSLLKLEDRVIEAGEADAARTQAATINAVGAYTRAMIGLYHAIECAATGCSPTEAATSLDTIRGFIPAVMAHLLY